MSDVKIAPKQRSFYENFDRIFKQTPCASASGVVDMCPHASEIQGVLESKPRTPLIAPDSTGRASSAPREAANITDPNGPRLAFTVANSFTGDWFGFVL